MARTPRMRTKPPPSNHLAERNLVDPSRFLMFVITAAISALQSDIRRLQETMEERFHGLNSRMYFLEMAIDQMVEDDDSSSSGSTTMPNHP